MTEEVNYEKKYKKALEWMQGLYSGLHGATKEDAEHYFPELKKNEDERIRKGLIKAVSRIFEGNKLFDTDVTREEALAWLEKQGNKPVNIDVESMVSSYEQRLKSQGGIENSPLVNMCLTAFIHGVENVLEELNFKHLEKQGEQMTKPRFKEGDWITDGRITYKVLGVTGKSYDLHLHNDDYCHFETDIQCVDKYYRLWTIQDAKDGDVLVCEDENFTIPFIAIYKCLGDTVYNYNGLKDLTFNSHCFMGFNGNFYEGEGGHVIEGIHPGTKEQRNLLFQKMKEAGYEWDSEKKELKKIEPKKVNANKVINWVNPDKVIEWLKNTIKETEERFGYNDIYKETRLTLPYDSIEDFINDFKEDFELC